MTTPFSFNEEETALILDDRFFRQKARITEKVRGQLDATRECMRVELGRATLLAPSEFDLNCVQFVKGEHLEQFPYQYLDCPKYFRGVEKCTFRTLFWWGHHVAVAWLLEGVLVKRYKNNLFDRYHTLAGQGLELSMAPTLWEWKRGAGFTLPMTHDRKAQIAAVVAERSFLKIIRFVPLDDSRVRDGALPDIVREAFVSMKPILSP